MEPITAMAQFLVLLLGWAMEDNEGVQLNTRRDNGWPAHPIIAEFTLGGHEYPYTRGRWIAP